MITQPNRLEEARISQERLIAQVEHETVPPTGEQDGVSPAETESTRPGHNKELLQMVNRFNTELGHSDVALKIRVDPETGKNLIKVVDRKTGEVIREIPPEEVVRLAARIEKMIGIFLDRSV